MIVLSIDPSYNYCGFVVAKVDGKKCEIIHMETFTVKQKTHKAFYLRQKVDQVIADFKPDIVYYENQYSQMMGQICGVILGCILPPTKIDKIHVKKARAALFKGMPYDKETIYNAALLRWPNLPKNIDGGIVDALIQLVSQHPKKKVVFKNEFRRR